MRRATRATLAAAAGLVAAAPAWAGTYDVTACGSAGVNRAWVGDNQFPAAFALRSTCPLQATSSGFATTATFFQYAGWRFVPPAGTVVDRLRIQRFGYRFLDRNDNHGQGGWITEGRTEDGQIAQGFFVESCRNTANGLCSFGVNDANGAAADWDIDGTNVIYQVVCVRFGTCDTGNGSFPYAGVTTFSAVATVRDDTAPALTAAGSLLADGWHRPGEPIAVTASDATGISSAVASAGGATGSLPAPCDYTRPAPCGRVSGDLTLSALADGTQPLTLTVKDAAGNPTSITRTINVDGTAPSAILQSASGRTIAVKVADELSGVASGQISVRGSSAEPYRPLPTTLVKGRLTAKLDRGRIAPTDVRVAVTDNAGNSAAGVPARFDAPSRVRVRYGRRVTLRGRLTLSAGQPLRGVPVQATATIRRAGATAAPAGETSTDARGRFRLTLPAGPSRTVRLIFPGAADALRSVRLRIRKQPGFPFELGYSRSATVTVR